MRKRLLTCGLIAVACLVSSVASAQNRGSNGSSNTGSSGFGNTGSFGSGSAGSSGFGTTGSSGLGGSSGFGSTGFGAQNGLGTNGQSGFGGQNQLGANGNNGGILGRNTNQNQFLGRNVQNQGAGGNTGLGGGRGGGGNRGNNGLNSQNGGGNGANANQTPLVRPRQKVAFDYRLPTSAAIQTTLETRLTKLSAKAPGLKSVMVAVEDKGEVVLRGEVTSVSESKLAENMLRLEPGVRTVRNELTFPATSSSDE